MAHLPPTATLFPYTTLFRSAQGGGKFVVANGAESNPQSHKDHQLLTFHPHRRSEEHTSELQSRGHLVCRLLLAKKKKDIHSRILPGCFLLASIPFFI